MDSTCLLDLKQTVGLLRKHTGSLTDSLETQQTNCYLILSELITDLGKVCVSFSNPVQVRQVLLSCNILFPLSDRGEGLRQLAGGRSETDPSQHLREARSLRHPRHQRHDLRRARRLRRRMSSKKAFAGRHKSDTLKPERDNSTSTAVWRSTPSALD